MIRANRVVGVMIVLLAQGLTGCGDDATPDETTSSGTSTGSIGGDRGDGGSNNTGGADGGGGSDTGGSGGSGGSTGGADGSGGSSNAGGAGGGSNNTGGAGGGSTGGDEIVWTPCPLYTDGDGDDAECAEIAVPLRWDEPDGETITFFVKRKLAATQPSRGQLWLLNGGPGLSGADYEPFAEQLAALEPTLDLYLPDHRGTGRSSRLGCPDGEAPDSELGISLSNAEVVACLAALEASLGDKIKAFNITNAARDVGEIIARTREPGHDVFVSGESYGSILGHRYLQLYPDQPTGVALSAVAIHVRFSDMDAWFNNLGRRIMDACGADPFCAERLGADPWATMTQTLDAFEEGACPEVAALGFNRALLQQVFANVAYSWALRPLIPALTYRLSRCEEADIAAFDHLASIIFTPAPPSASVRLASDMLRNHIALSELWADPPPPASEVEAFLAQANVAIGVTGSLNPLHAIWPRYAPDPLASQWAATSAPLLFLHGELDFIPSSITDPVQSRFTGPNQTFVRLPRTSHTVFESPTSQTAPQGGSCALELLLQFIADPEAGLDTSCTETIPPLDFRVDPGLSGLFLGTEDAWGEGDLPAPPEDPADAPSPELARAIVHLRQAVRSPGHGRAP